MCGFCIAAELKDYCDEEDFGSLEAHLIDSGFEGQVVGIDQSVTGTLETGEANLYQIDVEAGQTVQIDLSGLDLEGEDGVKDTVVAVYDSEGNLVTFNDDVNGLLDRDSSVTFTAESDGPYYIEVGSHRDNFSGAYQMDVFTTASLPSGPTDAVGGDNALDDSDVIKVYFAQAGEEYQAVRTTTASGTNAYEQEQWMEIFDGVSEFADIQFEVTTDKSEADLEIVTGDLKIFPGFVLYGIADFPTASGEGGAVQINNTIPGYSETPGGSMDTAGYMYGVAIHELGHALGLGHPHDPGNGSEVMDGVSNDGDTGDFELNQAVYTAMSYNDGSTIAGSTGDDANTGNRGTFGALDIAVLQEYYGVNTTHASGNDTYSLFDSNATGSGAGYYTIWDTGGEDVIEYTGSKNATIDLREATLLYEEGGGGYLSYVDGVIGGFTIANGVDMENAFTGSGEDTVKGNDLNNSISTNEGDDRVCGKDGDDKLLMGDGNDIAVGGAGNDELVGHAGDDVLWGAKDNDELRGLEGNDTLVGRSGNDTLDGGSGSNEMRGGSGDDTFVFVTGNDLITDFETSGDVIDLSGNAQITGFADLSNNHISQFGSAVIIDDNAGNTLVLQFTDLADLDASHFIF